MLLLLQKDTQMLLLQQMQIIVFFFIIQIDTILQIYKQHEQYYQRATNHRDNVPPVISMFVLIPIVPTQQCLSLECNFQFISKQSVCLVHGSEMHVWRNGALVRGEFVGVVGGR